VFKRKKTVRTKSIRKKLEAINKITNVVKPDKEIYSVRNYLDLVNIDFNKEVRRLEIELINYALFQAKGNQTRAARSLNLKKTTLHAKIKKLNLQFFSVSSDNDKTD